MGPVDHDVSLFLVLILSFLILFVIGLHLWYRIELLAFISNNIVCVLPIGHTVLMLVFAISTNPTYDEWLPLAIYYYDSAINQTESIPNCPHAFPWQPYTIESRSLLFNWIKILIRRTNKKSKLFFYIVFHSLRSDNLEFSYWARSFGGKRIIYDEDDGLLGSYFKVLVE